MPVIDIHAYLGAPPESVRQGNLQEIQRVLTASKINAALLASGRAATGDFRRGNEQVQQALEGRVNVFGLATVNPSYPNESAEELRRRLSGTLFRGVKVARASAGPRLFSEGLRAILNAARRYGRPVLVETQSEADVRDTVLLAKEFHALKFVLLGMGGEHWESAIGACEQQLNTILEIGSLDADCDKVADAVAAVGPRRVMFGSHFPTLHPMYVLGMMRDAAIEDRDRERILFRNAVETFELDLTNAPLGTPRSELGGA
ncbi:MAG: amidohydrolase family protein [Armatimonadetes bacterium]|nr:amidohydrolase family protein [Armatimonadota bacterium]